MLNSESGSFVPSNKFPTVIAQDVNKVWSDCLNLLKTEIDPQVFLAYIDPLRVCNMDLKCSEFVLSAPSKFLCSHVDRNFRDRILKVVSTRLGLGSLTLRFIVDQPKTDSTLQSKSLTPFVVVKKIPQQGSKALFKAAGGDDSQDPPNLKYTFDNFIVGLGNQFCQAAALRVAEEPGKSYNPLFIYGGVGLGKTHLLHAIGNAVLNKFPGKRVVYLSSEAFTNELIQALRAARMEEFKRKFRSVDLLLIDDIQFMSGKERTQEEFFHTFNVLYNAKCQIVLTSDRIPQDISGLEERLRTRFSWGLSADIQAPDFETRVAILNKRASLDSFDLPIEVAQYVAEHISSNVRELEGALTKLHAISSVHSLPLSLELAEKSLRPLIEPKNIKISVGDVKKAVSTFFGIKISDMVSKRRSRNISFPRQVAMYICRKHTTLSYPEIGAEFGGRDHSSVIHAANVVSSKLETHGEVLEIVKKIEISLIG